MVVGSGGEDLLSGLASLAPNSAGVIDPGRGRIVAQIPTGVRPGRLASSEGAVWVANVADESISRIDPDTKALVRTISTGSPPTGLAVGGGRIWVSGRDSSLSWIDPQFNQLTRTIARLGDPDFYRDPPHDLAAGFGSIWIADPIGRLVRVDPSTGRIVSSVDLGRGASGVAVGAGSVWVANTHDGTVSRVDPTGVVTATIPVGHGPTGIAFGEGRVWVAVSLDGVVASVDPETNEYSCFLETFAGGYVHFHTTFRYFNRNRLVATDNSNTYIRNDRRLTMSNGQVARGRNGELAAMTPAEPSQPLVERSSLGQVQSADAHPSSSRSGRRSPFKHCTPQATSSSE